MTWSPVVIDLYHWYVSHELHMIKRIFLGYANLNNSIHVSSFLYNNMELSQQAVNMTHRTYPWVAPVHFYPSFYCNFFFFFLQRGCALPYPCMKNHYGHHLFSCLFPRRNDEAVVICDNNESGVPAPPQVSESTCDSVLSSSSVHHIFWFQTKRKVWCAYNKPDEKAKRLQVALEDPEGQWALGQPNISGEKTTTGLPYWRRLRQSHIAW